MSRISLRVLVAGVLACAVPAFGQIIDGFETGTVGSPPAGWTDFGGSQPFVVSNTQAHTGTKSMRLSEGTDTQGNTTTGYGSDVWKNFLPAGGYTTGTVVFSYWQFVDPGVDSTAFMYISTGRMPTTFETGLDLRADGGGQGGFGANQLLVVQNVGTQPTLQANPIPLVKGRWVEHSMTINLDTDRYNYSYDGVVRVTNLEWDRNPSPAGTGSALSGINFWMQLGNANNQNEFVYYDDFNTVVVPEPTTAMFALLGCGGLAVARRRRSA
jgi:hypothetical protein